MKDRNDYEFFSGTSGDNRKSSVHGGSSAYGDRSQFTEILHKNGAPSNAIISRMILDSNAIVPNSGPLYSVMNILERE